MPLLITAVFVVLPILAAVTLSVLGTPATVGPLVIVATGIAWVVLAGRITMSAERYFAAASGVPMGEGLDSVEGKQVLAERPHAVWVPSLVTASWIDILIGIVWLAFVDLRVMLGTVILLAIAFFGWRRSGQDT